MRHLVWQVVECELEVSASQIVVALPVMRDRAGQRERVGGESLIEADQIGIGVLVEQLPCVQRRAGGGSRRASENPWQQTLEDAAQSVDVSELTGQVPRGIAGDQSRGEPAGLLVKGLE